MRKTPTMSQSQKEKKRGGGRHTFLKHLDERLIDISQMIMFKIAEEIK